jgi:hypothetical protein
MEKTFVLKGMRRYYSLANFEHLRVSKQARFSISKIWRSPDQWDLKLTGAKFDLCVLLPFGQKYIYLNFRNGG